MSVLHTVVVFNPLFGNLFTLIIAILVVSAKYNSSSNIVKDTGDGMILYPARMRRL